MIKNEAHPQREVVEVNRAQIEHRATWFALMIEAAEKRGLDIEFAREAIFKCGCFHGETKFPRTDDLHVFNEAFATDLVKESFEMDVTCTDEEMKVVFHYCPLVNAWKKLGIPDEKMPSLCDTAMDGDRGIISKYDAFTYHLGDTIAKGCDTCVMTITKNK